MEVRTAIQQMKITIVEEENIMKALIHEGTLMDLPSLEMVKLPERGGVISMFKQTLANLHLRRKRMF